MKQVAETLATFSGRQAVWWLAPATRLDILKFAPANREVDLVVGADGQELGRWRLNQASYGKLLSELRKQPRGSYAIAHAADIYYDDFERLPAIKVALDRRITTMLRLVQSLEQGKYYLDDNPLVFYDEAQAWWTAADALFYGRRGFVVPTASTRAGQVLPMVFFEELMYWRNMQWHSGAPKSAYHCTQLVDELVRIEAFIAALQRFFLQHPLPPVRPGRMGGFRYTPGDGSRYPHRAVFT